MIWLKISYFIIHEYFAFNLKWIKQEFFSHDLFISHQQKYKYVQFSTVSEGNTISPSRIYIIWSLLFALYYKTNILLFCPHGVKEHENLHVHLQGY